MSHDRYRQNVAECLDQAAKARKSEDVDAWLLIAEEWLRLAAEVSGTDPHSNRSLACDFLLPNEGQFLT